MLKKGLQARFHSFDNHSIPTPGRFGKAVLKQPFLAEPFFPFTDKPETKSRVEIIFEIRTVTGVKSSA